MERISERTQRDIIKARSINKHRRTTSQAIRDHEQLMNRISKLGIKVDYVSAYLDYLYGTHATVFMLLPQAEEMEKKLQIEVDRLARRSKQALICWYAENWEVIYPYINVENEQSGVKLGYERFVQKKDFQKGYEIDISDISQLINHH
ncbi:hypothetical protein TVAG_041970 [Trichomonas vaginalis G3]|uniref:Uncharacterized protein n=1 Tax=Trichomonas vaginalis (strain ATCC PRA-98 / G3) TaxID=412133 RepID=A2EUT6_TRIV3|nr:hypothetical protein TVAGG3_0192070 [Trichomonas vaginalis G3]EAY03545.1 hypothetical protein TVAG_041970 [Trichomonas vaginalis G3]KAI5550046.1 hypothetical protein TVAGG3_0192070 [Trichomonas vaginalis G3]|eukprot:XP_001315768.1 hypothetical protein [Trichomonas vaginalis G3]